MSVKKRFSIGGISEGVRSVIDFYDRLSRSTFTIDVHREGVREGAVAERNDSSSLSTAAAIASAADAAEAVVAATRWCGSQRKRQSRGAGASCFVCVAAAATIQQRCADRTSSADAAGRVAAMQRLSRLQLVLRACDAHMCLCI